MSLDPCDDFLVAEDLSTSLKVIDLISYLFPLKSMSPTPSSARILRVLRRVNAVSFFGATEILFLGVVVVRLGVGGMSSSSNFGGILSLYELPVDEYSTSSSPSGSNL